MKMAACGSGSGATSYAMALHVRAAVSDPCSSWLVAQATCFHRRLGRGDRGVSTCLSRGSVWHVRGTNQKLWLL